MLEKIKLYAWPVALSAVFGGAAATGFGLEVDSELIKTVFGEAANSQIAQAGFFFTVAAWLHSGRVKREIKDNFQLLTLAINNVAESFREDLKKHGERLDNLSSRVESLETKTKE